MYNLEQCEKDIQKSQLLVFDTRTQTVVTTILTYNGMLRLINKNIEDPAIFSLLNALYSKDMMVKNKK